MAKDDIFDAGKPNMVSIKIQESTDPKADQVLEIPDNETIWFGQPQTVFIRKGQMVSGKSGILIYAKIGDKHVMIETTGALFKMVGSAISGVDGLDW